MSSSHHRRWDTSYLSNKQIGATEFGIWNFILKYFLSLFLHRISILKIQSFVASALSPVILWSVNFTFAIVFYHVLGGTLLRPLKIWSQMSWPAILLQRMFNMCPPCLHSASRIMIINQVHIFLCLLFFIIFIMPIYINILVSVKVMIKLCCYIYEKI